MERVRMIMETCGSVLAELKCSHMHYTCFTVVTVPPLQTLAYPVLYTHCIKDYAMTKYASLHRPCLHLFSK